MIIWADWLVGLEGVRLTHGGAGMVCMDYMHLLGRITREEQKDGEKIGRTIHVLYMYLAVYIVTSMYLSIVARGDDAYRERIFYSVLLPPFTDEIGLRSW